MAYATPGDQILLELSVPDGATVADVLETCRAGSLLPDQVLRNPDIGVFGRRVDRNYALHSGDRVEFYRPLTVDPKEARRRRAAVRQRRRAGPVGDR